MLYRVFVWPKIWREAVDACAFGEEEPRALAHPFENALRVPRVSCLDRIAQEPTSIAGVCVGTDLAGWRCQQRRCACVAKTPVPGIEFFHTPRNPGASSATLTGIRGPVLVAHPNGHREVRPHVLAVIRLLKILHSSREDPEVAAAR